MDAVSTIERVHPGGPREQRMAQLRGEPARVFYLSIVALGFPPIARWRGRIRIGRVSDDSTIGVSGEAPARLALVLWAGDEPRVVALEPGRAIVLGRSAPADLVVETPTLSREHVRIESTDARVVVTDLGSKNGIRVAGQRVERAELAPGEAFDAGGVQVLVTAVLPHATRPSRSTRRALLDAIDAEQARSSITTRGFCVAVIAGDVDPTRLRPIDRAAQLDDNVCVLLPELDAPDARALLASRYPNVRAGIASSRTRSAAALVDAAKRALGNTGASAPIVIADLPVEQEPDVVLASARIRETFALAERFAVSDRPVLVLGETGTGKELVSQRIHAASARAKGPLVVLNCAAIPTSLVESTLFGHERGAFTGANERRRGAFEEASGGTLFLDEIGELPLGAQAALLRVLETGRLSRVGSSEEIAVDVRVVAATHRDLSAAAQDGGFRADLWHRLGVLVIVVPPLRERPEDVAALARAFMRRACASAHKPALSLDATALSTLLSYAWPGNVRELRNVIERAVLLASGPSLTILDLAREVRGEPNVPEPPSGAAHEGWDLRARLRDYEAEVIVAALEACGGNQVAAAELLGLPRRTLVHKIGKLGLRRRWERR
jgi:DNA-binding NtrC family response regulator